MICAVAGATGLIGSHCVQELLNDPSFSKVIAVSRSELEVRHAKLLPILTSFDALESHSPVDRLDVALCALGTTIKKAGTKENFRRVDHEYVLEFAKWAKHHGANHFIVVSASGANHRSLIFYNRVKGEMENELRAMGFDALDIFRPSLLMGERKEHRTAEKFAQAVSGFIAPVLPTSAKPIQARDVALAMVQRAKNRDSGTHVFHYNEIIELARHQSRPR